jgi:hypothetical protein
LNATDRLSRRQIQCVDDHVPTSEAGLDRLINAANGSGASASMGAMRGPWRVPNYEADCRRTGVRTWPTAPRPLHEPMWDRALA